MLVIEILEHQIDVTNNDACAYFLKDLADSNEASSSTEEISHYVTVNLHHEDDDYDDEMKTKWFPNLSLSIPASTTDEKCCACIARGSQRVMRGGGSKEGPSANKNNDDDAAHQWINVDICVLRLPTIQTDLLITLSTPHKEEKCDTTIPSSCKSEDMHSVSDQYGSFFQEILKTFNINDWSLFAC